MTKHIKDPTEVRRLYEAEELTLQQIAEQIGVARQTIRNRLAKAGVRIRPRTYIPKLPDRDLLYQLYVEQGLTLAEVGKRLGFTETKVWFHLVRNGIERRKRGTPLRKYDELRNLKLNESVIVSRDLFKNPYFDLHKAAKRRGIKISVRTLDESSLKVTRVL